MRLNQVPSCALAMATTVLFAGRAEGFFAAAPFSTRAAKLLVSSSNCAPSSSCPTAPAAVAGKGGLGRAGCIDGGLREALGGRSMGRGSGSSNSSRSRGVVAAGKDGGDGASGSRFGLADKTIEELWTRPRKHLMSVGKAGVKPSHVRSLNALVEAHTLVKVKINIPGADLGEVGLQLCGTEGSGSPVTGGDEEESSPISAEGASSPLPVSVSVVTNRDNQRIILFAKTEFLESLAKGEVFNN